MNDRETKVQGDNHLYKDEYNKAIINKNTDGYRARKNRKQEFRDRQSMLNDIASLKKRVATLELLLKNPK